MLKIEKELQRVFSHRQVGSITRCLEPIILPSSVEWIEEEFLEDEDIDALPIENNGVIVGILEKETFFRSLRKFGKEIKLKDIKDFLLTEVPEINAEDIIDNIFEKIMSKEKHKISPYFVVYYRSSYMGFVSLLQIIKQMNSLLIMDMEKAREVQTHLLEKSILENQLLEFRVYNKMAARVGGDFYINHIYKNKNFQIIGCFDVSGKGFSASMGTIVIGSFITALSINEIEDTNPLSFSQKLDEYVKELIPEGSFIAGALAFVDYDKGRCFVQNFGLPPVYIFDSCGNKKILKILKSSLPPFGLGNLSNIKAMFVEFEIKKNLRIIMLTDGLPELKDPYGTQFGDDAVQQMILKNSNLKQMEFIKVVSETIEKHRKYTSFSDDITLIDIRFN